MGVSVSAEGAVGVVAPPLLNPQDIFGSRLSLWYDAIVQGQTSGTLVEMTDQSLKLNHATQATPAFRAVAQVNADGKPEWLFSGMKTYQFSVIDFATTDWHVFLLINTDDDGTDRTMLGFDQNSLMRYRSNDARFLKIVGGNFLPPGATPLGSYQNQEWSYESGLLEVRLDGVGGGTVAGADGFKVDNFGAQQFSLENFPYQGLVRLVAVVTGTVTAQDRTDMNTYIQTLEP